jgi:hypothetical protein
MTTDKVPSVPPVASDGIRVAVVVDPAMPAGLLANTVAALSIGLGAAHPALGGTPLRDAADRAFTCSANRPVPILQAPAESLRALMLKALAAPPGATVVPFPRYARSIQVFEEYRARFATVDLAGEVIEGIALGGPEKWVRSLTGSLKLLR